MGSGSVKFDVAEGVPFMSCRWTATKIWGVNEQLSTKPLGDISRDPWNTWAGEKSSGACCTAICQDPF